MNNFNIFNIFFIGKRIDDKLVVLGLFKLISVKVKSFERKLYIYIFLMVGLFNLFYFRKLTMNWEG